MAGWLVWNLSLHTAFVDLQLPAGLKLRVNTKWKTLVKSYLPTSSFPSINRSIAIQPPRHAAAFMSRPYHPNKARPKKLTMDPVNFFRGYDKVSHLENQNPSQKPVSTAIAIFAILIFTLVVGLTLAAVMLEPIKEPADTASPSLSSNSDESIRTICNVTRFPESCFTTLSSLSASTKPDPESILQLSLQVAINHLSNLSSSLKSLNDLHSQPALKDCVTLFDDALSRLNDSVSAMQVGSGKELVLTKEKISDIQTWISAAMSDQETCNDGLQEMGSTVADKVKSQVRSSKESISNSLAIVSNMHNLLQKFGLTMH
ncbi:PREDICTED: pectinesterase 3 [Theobroma cacao]|uniref:pectinesterase n=1 Tax=Theobroma cacao TaxID=3641 RepID=A0AB32VC61_THECC|nr:PREDICTED: pectinesterase 3 [Theobroma cacao]